MHRPQNQNIKIYNSLTGEKEQFKSIHEGSVGMYVCGPTVYNLLHIGNFRGPIFFNLLRNWLEHLKYKVKYVYNYTDIDDKIIKSNNKLREKGFVLSTVSPGNGIFRGSERTIHMGDFSENSIFNGNNIQYMAMESGGWKSNDYPGSLLGSIALIRQTFYDAKWYTQAWKIYNKFPKTNKRPEIDDALNNLSESLKKSSRILFFSLWSCVPQPAIPIRMYSSSCGFNPNR